MPRMVAEPLRLFDVESGREWGEVRLVRALSLPHGFELEVRQIRGAWQRFMAFTIVKDHLAYAIFPNNQASPHAFEGPQRDE